MGRKKDIKLILDTYGNYLGMRKGCIVLSDKDKNETIYPLVEESVGEIVRARSQEILVQDPYLQKLSNISPYSSI